MHANAKLLHDFYEAFSRRDAGPMASAYAADAHFTDEVFPALYGERIGMMWGMLCAGDEELKIEASGIEADGVRGRARWEAWYTFGGGRKVHNIIDATFEFRDGRIVRHIDRFDFWRWSRQALGPPGVLFGWSGLLQRKVQALAGAQLERYIERHGAS